MVGWVTVVTEMLTATSVEELEARIEERELRGGNGVELSSKAVEAEDSTLVTA